MQGARRDGLSFPVQIANVAEANEDSQIVAFNSIIESERRSDKICNWFEGKGTYNRQIER